MYIYICIYKINAHIKKSMYIFIIYIYIYIYIYTYIYVYIDILDPKFNYEN